jgi:2-polyprenyl-3-methyl-5-hydroxy-6-metoxy-1,4-benzoquinol methylase
MGLKSKVHHAVGHLVARWNKKYYYEDFVRVYPGEKRWDIFGRQKKAKPNDINNYKNHVKSYRFAAQFVAGKSVLDVGCGAGYGCKIFLDAGAQSVSGTDLSEHALAYAEEQYGDVVDFKNQSVTDMTGYADNSFDLSTSFEVLEHVKEYGKEAEMLTEMKRVTKPGGLVVIATPNCELLGDHGFWHAEIEELFSTHFSEHALFENALVPNGPGRLQWEERKKAGQLATVVSEDINIKEIVWHAETPPEVKQGIEPGEFSFSGLEIDTRLLHNTHGWMVVARI